MCGTWFIFIDLQGPLDRELRESYEVTVYADDGNSSHSCELHVTVKVLDVNDHSPTFQNATYTVFVQEDQALNKVMSSALLAIKNSTYNL